MPQQQILDAMASRKQGFTTMLSTASAADESTRNVGGVSCRILNYGDDNGDTKIAAIDAAVKLLTDKGYNLPNTVSFHLSSHSEGFQKAPTEAFARTKNGAVGVDVFLGVNSIYSAQALQQGLKEGIAHKLNNYGLGDYTTAVAVHELGHVMHDVESTDFFWGEGDKPMQIDDVMIAHKQISPYSAVNKKEVVAEVFCAHNMGLKFHGPQVQSLYEKFEGPQLR